MLCSFHRIETQLAAVRIINKWVSEGDETIIYLSGSILSMVFFKSTRPKKRCLRLFIGWDMRDRKDKSFGWHCVLGGERSSHILFKYLQISLKSATRNNEPSAACLDVFCDSPKLRVWHNTMRCEQYFEESRLTYIFYDAISEARNRISYDSRSLCVCEEGYVFDVSGALNPAKKYIYQHPGFAAERAKIRSP